MGYYKLVKDGPTIDNILKCFNTWDFSTYSTIEEYVDTRVAGTVWGNITGTLADQTDLVSALNSKATDSNVVHKVGIEQIDGIKTFTQDVIRQNDFYQNKIILGSHNYNAQLQFKGDGHYSTNVTLQTADAGDSIDLNVYTQTLQRKTGVIALDNDVVHLSGTETITGSKTIEGLTTFDNIAQFRDGLTLGFSNTTDVFGAGNGIINFKYGGTGGVDSYLLIPDAGTASAPATLATTDDISTAVSGKADDSDVVHLAGAEEITGKKTIKNELEFVQSGSGGTTKLVIKNDNGYNAKIKMGGTENIRLMTGSTEFGTSIRPLTDNQYDVGYYNTQAGATNHYRWRNGYFTGVLSDGPNSISIADICAIAGSAATDATVVHKTGTEEITGNKTFKDCTTTIETSTLTAPSLTFKGNASGYGGSTVLEMGQTSGNNYILTLPVGSGTLALQSEIPANFIESASASGSTLTLTPNVGSAITFSDNNQKVKVGTTEFPQNDIVNFIGGNNITITGNPVNSSITINEAAPIFIPSVFNVGTETITLSQADMTDIYTNKYNMIILDDQSLGVDINYVFKKTVESTAANVVKYDCTSISTNDTVLHIGLSITNSNGTYTPTADCVTLSNAWADITSKPSLVNTFGSGSGDITVDTNYFDVSSNQLVMAKHLYQHNICFTGHTSNQTVVTCTITNDVSTGYNATTFCQAIYSMFSPESAPSTAGLAASGIVRIGGMDHEPLAQIRPGSDNTSVTLCSVKAAGGGWESTQSLAASGMVDFTDWVIQIF